jgi:hypothetical protein
MKQSGWLRKVWGLLLGAALLASFSIGGTGAYNVSPAKGTTHPKQSTRTITAYRRISAFPVGSSNAVITPDIKGAVFGLASRAVNRSLSRTAGALRLATTSGALTIPHVTASKISTSSGVVKSFTGITDYQQRYVASGGNQFTITPPDQGLCVGNGLVLETVNDTIRLFDTNGNALSNPIGLNAFYGYPPEINRTPGVKKRFGPEPTDPSCYFDPQYGKWFHVALTLETNPTSGALTLVNHLDLAVSATSDPRDGWIFYHIPVQDDGTQGTVNHSGCPCIGDFPHIGADKFGFYITTNEYPFSAAPGIFGNNYNGAQIYAMSKFELAANSISVPVTQIEGPASGAAGVPSFTLWPNEVPGTAYDTGNGGTEWFLQSTATIESLNFSAMSNNIVVWSLTNTASLDAATPTLQLSAGTISSEVYGIPPLSEQKAGPIPLRDCLQTGCGVPGTGLSLGEVPAGFDSSDSRILTNWLAGGKLYGALGTVVNVNGHYEAGVAFFVINTGGGLTNVSIANQGYVAVAGNITYPSIATLADGTGVMALTLVGASWYPSAAYMSVDATGPTGSVKVAKAGAGPDDEFCAYLFYNCGGGPTPLIRARWGDYGAAVVDGNSIWIASEFIAQQCTIDTYIADPKCGGTRAPLGNWATRITRVQ